MNSLTPSPLAAGVVFNSKESEYGTADTPTYGGPMRPHCPSARSSISAQLLSVVRDLLIVTSPTR
ncbi:hypothetical protein M378DRAFT_154986 [Amanita muscaria Koide BX008]|uniref:Uncharacterized protein n=1 Tax=Amanita muscaria (strain Koide BX008) TaxID=946122 RepID=A0A0C2TVQ1_AMAMK|nr:hypothetical protein M378DRAFT_154986 [Amanita muscaria Koide BX008]